VRSTLRRQPDDAGVWCGVLALGLCLLAVGCTPEGSTKTDFHQLNGLFIADDGVYVVPDRAWRREGDAGGSFRKTATLLVYIQNDHPDGLRVTYRPDGDTERYHFLASWDEEPIWDRPETGASGPLVADVPPSGLSPGLHRIRLERLKSLDEPPDQEQGRNFFSRVLVERIDSGVASPQPIIPNGYLARFLDFGVTSQTSTQLSGCLFYGPKSHSFEFASPGEGEVSFILQNQSRAKARFGVRIDGILAEAIEVDPRDWAPIRFPLAAGRHTVSLDVEGKPNGCFLWGAPHLARRVDREKTTVVLITLDTTRRDAVAPFNGRPDLTPVLHRFSEQASIYTNAYATSPWTLPSHASIFTGLYPSNHRAGVFDDVLAESWLTLAERFRAAGYRTGGFIGGHMASSDFGLAQGFSYYRDPRKNEEPADVITDAAVGFVERNAELPLFLFLNYFDPHAPYSAPAEFQELVGVDQLAGPIRNDPIWGAFDRDEPGSWAVIANGGAPHSEAGLAYLRARYLAEVAFMDHQIGRLFAVLKTHNLFDDALIVLVSDHGEFLGERGLFSHSYRLDRELTAVPLLVKWPRQKTGDVVNALISHVDLYPAIAESAGLDVPASDGIAFGQDATDSLISRERVYLEEHKSRFHQLPGPFKIADHLFGMQWFDAREVFFPGLIECRRRIENVWVSDDCVSSWEQRIAELPSGMQATLELKTTDSVADLDEDEVERLRALGYLQ